MIGLLTSLFKQNPQDFDDSTGHTYYQVLFLNVLSLIGILALGFFSVYNIFFGIKSLGLWESAITLIVTANLILFQKHQNIKLGSIIIMLTMITLSLVLLKTGGIENTGIYWLYIFPILAFFLQGSFYGFLWIIAFILVNLVVAVLARLDLFTLSYSFIEVRQFLASMLVLSLMVYFYEKVVERMKKNLENNNKRLEEQVQIELQKNREKDYLLVQQSRQAQMGEMISMIAHQWRQPLSAISATVGSLQMKQTLGKYEKEYFDKQLENISGFSQHLSHTIEDFRNFFKEEKNESSTSLEKIIQDAISIVKPTLDSKNISLTTDFKCNQTLFTYPNELKQVMLNLLTNSQESLEEKNIKNPQIIISTFKDDDSLCFQVQDNAGGIPDDIIDKVFDPYFTTKGKLQGTGLGLYMSKKIINEHCHGSLTAKNINNGVILTCKLHIARTNNER